MDVKVEKGVLIFFVSFLISLLHLIQGWLAKLIWFFGVILPLKLVKNKDPKIPDENFIDWDNKIHKLVHNFVRFSFFINEKVSGVVNTHKAYERLVSWNAKLPLYAYVSTKTKGFYTVASDHGEDGSRGAGHSFWLMQNEKMGSIQIVKTYYEDNDKYMSIVATYTDGKYVGNKIIFKKNERLKDLDEKGKNYYPDSVYLPPKWLCYSFEILLSIGILSSLMAVVRGVYSLTINHR